MIALLMEKLRADPLEALRWHVALALGIAPYCQTDEEVVKCGLHLLLEREGNTCSTFDEERFIAMREGNYDS